MHHRSISAGPYISLPLANFARFLFHLLSAAWELLPSNENEWSTACVLFHTCVFHSLAIDRSTMHHFFRSFVEPLDACAVRRRNNEHPFYRRDATGPRGRRAGSSGGVRDTPTNEYSHQRQKLSPGITRVCPPLLTPTSSHQRVGVT